MANNDNSSNPKPAAETGKDKKKTQTEGIILPVLVEFTYTVSAILLVLLFLVIITISLLTGTKLLDIIIRTCVAVLAIGILLVLISRQVSSGMMGDIVIVQKKQINQQPSDEFEGNEKHTSSGAG
jgi:hypothetical protein